MLLKVDKCLLGPVFLKPIVSNSHGLLSLFNPIEDIPEGLLIPDT